MEQNVVRILVILLGLISGALIGIIYIKHIIELKVLKLMDLTNMTEKEATDKVNKSIPKVIWCAAIIVPVTLVGTLFAYIAFNLI